MDRSEPFTMLCALACDAQEGQALEQYLVKIRDVNELDASGRSPLMYAAAENKHLSVIETLLSAGARVNFEIVKQAVINNANVKISKLLYSQLPQISPEDLNRLFLLAAAANTHDELVRFFYAQGADLNSTLPMDLYPVIPPFEDEIPPNADEYWWDEEQAVQQNAIVVAMYENPNPVFMVKTLISLGVDLNAIDTEGFPVLIHALDNEELVKLLLAHGVAIDLADWQGMTALMHACAADSTPVALALINAQPNVHAKSLSGETALHFALGCHLHDNSAVVKALLAAGCKVNEPDGEGRMPLNIARFNYCSQSIIDLLIEAGAVMGDVS
ncbi:MAG: ankyrin repeat domain-containing protein [Sphaerochaetaceae bacterium]|nr:ankyrin repeat domain-containing protein [Sphaerochaetaceae bacterium]